jgi:hypothetical protein
MLEWRRCRRNTKPSLCPKLEAGVEAVCWHVEHQIWAFAGSPLAHVSEHSNRTDLLIGAYIWGLLDGYPHSKAEAEGAGDNSAEATILSINPERRRAAEESHPGPLSKPAQPLTVGVSDREHLLLATGPKRQAQAPLLVELRVRLEA